MGIIKDSLKKQIHDNNIQQFNDTTATIIEYSIVNNTAKIRYLNPNGDGVIYRDNVAISNTLGGVTGSGIHPGQSCSITFLKNNIHAPVITGLIGSNYSIKTCSDQGAYVVDSTILSTQEPDEIVPMSNSWLEDNQKTWKYNNDLGDYTQIDASESTHEFLNSLDKYKTTEQGITNLNTKSTMKLKDNGDIDMFVANNIGIRICPNNKTIEFYGMKFLFNGSEIEDFSVKNASISTSTSSPENTVSKVENATIPDIIKVSEISNLFKELDDTVAELKLCIQYTIDIMASRSELASLKSKIQNYEEIKHKYYNEIDSLTHDFIVETYDILLLYKETFTKELSDASVILEGV